MLPGRGLYARHIGHPEGVDGIHRTTVGALGTTRRPARFDPRWVSQHATESDVVHVHGLPAQVSTEEVAQAADAVRAAGRPLVVTAYHLSDPTGADDTHYRERLTTLLERADAVVTLTETAAAELHETWGVEALVLPHPHAVDFVRMRQQRPQRSRGELLVGLHLSRLNLPVDPLRLVSALARALRELPGARLLVHLHDTVLDPSSACYDAATAREIGRLIAPVRASLRVHRPLSESQLWDHLFALDVSVLPRLYGSHSVWPEACADLGTQALLPAGTHAAAQRPCLLYQDDPDAGPDQLADSMTAALATAAEQGCAWRADPEERWAERVKVAESLRGLYERLLHLDRR